MYSIHSVFLPVVHWWKGHGATVHRLTGWRRQWDLVVVRAAQSPTLICHHSPASTIMLASSTRAVSGSHLSSQDAGWWAGVGVGMASMVHGIGVVVLISTVTPDSDSRKKEEMKMEGEMENEI